MPPAPNHIEVRGLARRFGQRWAVAGVHFDVKAGSGLMVTGANGSGKTTLLRVLSTALRPQAGTVQIGGRDLWTERVTIREEVALVSHATRLYEDLSAADNLKAWARLGGFTVNVEAALAETVLEPRPEPVRTYSAGMRRRLALALALSKQPRIVLLDEPFAALDPAGREMVARVIQALKAQSVTLVIATHLPDLTRQHCEWAIHLDQGRLQWAGVPSEAPALDMAEALGGGAI